MKDQKVVGKRKNNPVAKQLSDPTWRKRVVSSKVIYNRKNQRTIVDETLSTIS